MPTTGKVAEESESRTPTAAPSLAVRSEAGVGEAVAVSCDDVPPPSVWTASVNKRVRGKGDGTASAL